MSELSSKKEDNLLIDCMVEVSGLSEFETPNGQVVLIYSNRYSDGTADVLQELALPQKPVIHCFKHAGFANVLIDFLSRDDADLSMAWDLLNTYSDPANSVDWSVEELETGFYTDINGQQRMVYFPMVEVVILPSGKLTNVHINNRTVYQLHGFNPAFYTLQPNGPKGEPCVLQLTFPEDWFVLEDELAPIDLDQIRDEVAEEIGMELGAGIDPKDLQ